MPTRSMPTLRIEVMGSDAFSIGPESIDPEARRVAVLRFLVATRNTEGHSDRIIVIDDDEPNGLLMHIRRDAARPLLCDPLSFPEYGYLADEREKTGLIREVHESTGFRAQMEIVRCTLGSGGFFSVVYLWPTDDTSATLLAVGVSGLIPLKTAMP